MSKAKTKKELDGVYFLKIAFYLILGSQWLYLINSAKTWQIPLPVGIFIGLLLVRNERFQIDRKIEYAILLISAFIGFWLPTGLYFTIR